MPYPYEPISRLKNYRRRPRGIFIIGGLLASIALLVGLYYVPPIHERLTWRLADLRTRIVYWLNPPDEVIFLPTQQSQVDLMVTQTLAAMQTPTATPIPPSGPTPTPTITPTPLPLSISLAGVVYVDQHNRWNYCGPANLTMALKFWGWEGTRDDVAKVVKPGIQDPELDFVQQGFWDKNVMPYEMEAFVNEHTEFRAVVRIGGDVDLLKRLIAGGFPVMIEKGYYERDYTGKVAWLGHYLFVTGYDEARQGFIVQDAYLEPGENLLSPYPEFIEGWRSFNYLFMVVYPPEREQDAYELLGLWGDPAWAKQHALDVANQEVQTLTGNDLYFSWFNQGSSHVALLQYGEAAVSFDNAFITYATLGSDDSQRPYRLMWYQTGPYWAYFYTGRYPDVISLANATFDTIDEDTLEESLYWRGIANFALGDATSAIADLREAVRLNPNFQAGLDKLAEWGVSP